MTTKQVLEAMQKGAVLCMGFGGIGPSNRFYWLEPKRAIVSNSIAESILTLPNVKKGEDGLFGGEPSQTWRF